MSSRSLDFGIIFRATDILSSPLKTMTRGVDALNRIAGNTTGLKKMSSAIDDISRATRNAGLAIGATGGGLAFALGLNAVPAQVVAQEHALRSMGNVAGLTAGQLGQASARIVQLSKETNQFQADLLGGLSDLTARSGKFKESMDLLPDVGRTATAMGADIGDMARTAFAMSDNLKIAAPQMKAALEAAAVAGQEGAFELKDMARYFPVLTAAAQNLGQVGVPAVGRLGSALQVAFKGAGDPSVAATNLENYMKALIMPITQANFKEHGMDLPNILRDIIARHGDIIEETTRLVQQMTGGDPIKLGELFRDAEAQNFLKPMLANMKVYRDIRDKAIKGGGLIDTNFANMMTTTAEQWKQLKINAAAVATGPMLPLLKAVNSVLAQINQSPGLQKALVYGAGFLTLAGGSLTALGFFGTQIANGLNLMAKWPGLLPRIAGALETVAIRGMYAADWLAKVGASSGVARLIAPLRAIGAASWSFTASLLLNPITLVIAAFASWGFAIYEVVKHWRVLKYELAQFGTNTIHTAGANIVKTLAKGMLSATFHPIGVMQKIVGGIRDMLPFSPAKVGPLKDLHRIKLVETIAESIRPAPLAIAMRRATATIATAAVVGAGGGRIGAPGGLGGASFAIDARVTIINQGGGAVDSSPELDRKLADQRRQIQRDVIEAVRGMARQQY